MKIRAKNMLIENLMKSDMEIRSLY